MRRATVFWANWGWAFGLAILALAAAPAMVREAELQGRLGAQKADATALNKELKQAEEQRKELISRSKERLETGCQPLLLNGEQVLIRAGMRVRDGVTGHPMQAGHCVNDWLGTTGITDAQGYITDIVPGPGQGLEPPKEAEKIKIEIDGEA